MKQIAFSPPDITEEEIAEVADTLRSGWITTGPKTKKFEQQIAAYCGTTKAVCLNSATASLELILRILDLGENDEVIVPAYTYTATASPVLHVGAKLIMIDSQTHSLEMDYEVLANCINENTKAIIAVDLAGIVCDYDRILSIVKEKSSLFTSSNKIQEAFNRVVVIADGAHSFGASNRNRISGSIADFTTFSFHAVKNLTTSEGGAITWKNKNNIDDEWLYNQFMLLSLHGQSKDALAKTQLGSWEYDIISPAYKCNMTDIAASIGLIQLKRYHTLLKRRKEIINFYDNSFKKMNLEVLEHYSDYSNSSGHLYMIKIPSIDEETRNKIIVKSAEKGISLNVHYKPLPMMTAYKKMNFNIELFPNAYNHYSREVTLPLHTRLSNEDIRYVIQNFSDVVSKYI